MDLERLATDISTLLPTYEIRLYLITFLLLGSVFLLISYKKNKSKRIKVLISLARLIIYTSILITLIYIFKFPLNIFRDNLLLSIPIIYIFLIYTTDLLLNIFCNNGKNIFTLTKISSLPVFLLIAILTTSSLLARPYVLSNTILDGNVLNNGSEIELIFSVPVKKSTLNITLSPEIETEYQYTTLLGLNNWITEVKLIPQRSFLPDQKVVVYTTGLKRILWGGEQHEQSIEYFTPPEPEIKGVSIVDGSKNVAVNTEIFLNLEHRDQNFVKWDIQFEPYTEYSLDRDNPEALVVKPENLKQGIEYKVQILKTVIQYDTQTEEELTRLETKVEKELHFTTVSPPGITNFNRKDSIISNKEPLKIDFEIPLKPESIEGKFAISPEIKGSISLSEDNKQLIFNPNESFAKNTEYNVVIKQGLENSLGGYIEQDIILKFRTAGTVAVSGIYPSNNSTAIAINIKNITLTFNQPVDHTSAQNNFSISPAVNGTFSWKDNTMYYSLSSNLEYGTKYSITINNDVKSLFGYNSAQKYTYSFTTKNETFILNVPLYYQSETFTCNLAATKMVLAYKGISISESGARDSIGIGEDPNSSWVDRYGTHWGPLSNYISAKGISNTVKRGWNLTEALKEVKSGHPVILYVYNNRSLPKGAFTLPGGATGYKGMHSEVIVGFVGKPENPLQIIINDPWLGKKYLSPSSLLNAWSYLNYTAIVVY